MIRPLPKMMLSVAAVAVTALALPTAAGAAGGSAVPTASDYVKKAAIGDMFEIQSSQLALQKSEDDDVRDFAQMMVDDHTKSTAMIKQAVAESGGDLSIPSSMDSKHESMLTTLQQTSADGFDRAYLDMQAEAHQQALDLHRSYAEGGDQQALKDVAEDIVPVIEKHIDELKELTD